VVISKECHFPEVQEVEAGFVVELSNSAIAEAISIVISDEALSAKLGQNSRKLVQERYQWTYIAQQTINRYQECKKNHHM